LADEGSAQSADTWPLQEFRFAVKIGGCPSDAADASFQEVSGLEANMEHEMLSEGGENRFQHKLPTSVKRSNLLLKRGIAPKLSPLVIWCKEVFEGGFATAIKPKDLQVALLNQKSIPLCVWSLTNAYPVKWSVGEFGASKNELAIEIIELAYSELKRIT